MQDSTNRSLAARIKRRILRSLPRSALLGLIRSYMYDYRRFVRHSFTLHRPRDREGFNSELVFYYHKLEKGLALRNPRPGFGANVIKKLDGLLKAYVPKFGETPVVADTMGAINAFARAGSAGGHPSGQAEQLVQRYACGERGGVVPVTRGKVQAGKLPDPEGFFFSRFSIRDFDETPIARADIERAIRMAQRSPSVCNRQSARVHVYTEPALRTLALSHQNGNIGFGHQACAVLILTSDLRCFLEPGERNQGFVDGGLFAMSLNYAFHAMGYGCCMLNWSREAGADRAMRRAMGIRDHEIVITMMAVGCLPETLKTAYSPRRPIEEVATLNQAPWQSEPGNGG